MPDNPWLTRRVIAYAHQGGAKEAPSSTLYAIRRALELGATGIELDVHATLDGELVVCHDPTLDRTTDATGEIANTRLDDLRQLDNAHWFLPGEDTGRDRPAEAYVLRGKAPADRDLGVATLSEVLEAFPDVVLNLDIKRSDPDVVAYEETLARALAEHGAGEKVIVASFLDSATAAFTRYAPNVGISAGTDWTTEFYRRLHAGSPPQEDAARYVALQVPARFGPVTVVDERFVEVAHSSGLAVHVWTIDDPEEMETLTGLGVDGIMTDKPTLLIGVLESLGANWKE